MFIYTQVLLQKVSQLEEAWTQKDKFIHSSRMIVRFREDHISRLEKKLKAGQSFFSDIESETLIDQLKEEIRILRDQVKKNYCWPSAETYCISIVTFFLEQFQSFSM